MADRSTVRVNFIGDADSLARAARAARGEMDSVASSVGKAAKIGSFFGSAAGNLAATGLGALKTFATGSVDAFAAIEDATGAAGVQFGTQTAAVVKFAEDAAGAFGLSKRAALDAQNTFGTMGKVAGLSGEGLSSFAQDLTGLSGDLASFKGTSTEQAIDAVGAALRGESEPLRAYGVLLDQATLEAEALAIGLVKPAKNMELVKAAQAKAMLAQKAYNAVVNEHGKDSDQAARAELALGAASRALAKETEGKIPPLTAANKVLAAQSAILKQTTDAQGDYSRTSTSTANTAKTLAAETENAQAKLGEKLAPALTAVRQASIQVISGMEGLIGAAQGAVGFVERNGTAFKVVAGIATAVLVPALARTAFGYAATGTAAVASGAKQAAAWLVAQGAAYRSGAAMVMMSVRIVGAYTLIAAQAVASAAKAAAAMVAAAAKQSAQWVRTAAVATAQAARMAAAWIISMGPIAIATAAVVGIAVLIVKNWDKIKTATAAAWNFVKDAIGKAIRFVTNIFINFTGPGLIIKHFDTIVAFVKGIPGKFLEIAGDITQAGVDLIQGFINGIIDKAGDIAGAITGFITDKIPGWIKNPLGIFSPSRVTRKLGQFVSEGMALGIQDKAKNVKTAVQGMVDALKEKLAEVRSFAKDIKASFIDSGDISGFDFGVERTTGTLLDQLKKRAAEAREFASGINALRGRGLNETSLKQLREAGPDGGLEAVRELRNGGDINEVNRLVKQIARGGENFGNSEAKRKFGIDPNAKLNVNGSSAGGRDIRVALQIDGKTITETIYKGLLEKQRRTGKLGLT